MPLSQDEELKFQELEKKFGGKTSLSPDEEAKFQELDAKFGQAQDTSVSSDVGNYALDKVIQLGRTVDKFSGAPVRAAIGSLQDDDPSTNPLNAYAKQFGADPDLAPRGRDIVQKQFPNISDKPIFDPTYSLDKKLEGQGFKIDEQTKGISPLDVAGFGIDVVADPLTFVPIAKVASGGAKAGGYGLNIAGKTSDKALKWSAKAADAASGSKVFSKGEGALREAVKATKNTASGVTNVLSTYLNPKVADDFDSLKAIAESNGIDPKILPEAVEFGENSFISRASRARAEGPLGGPKLDQYKEVQGQINQALNNQISNISGIGGGLSKKDAGSLIRQSYDEGVDKFFDQMGTTYDSLAKKYPGLKLEKASQVEFNDLLSELQNNAIKRYKNPVNAIEKQEAGNILQTIDTILQTGPDLRSSTDLLQRIGKYNFKSNALLSSPLDTVANKRLYGKLKESIIKTVESVDKKAAIDLIENNKALTEFFGDQSSLAKTLGSKSISDEGIFNNLVLNGDSKKVEALQKVLAPEQMQQLKASFLENLTKRNDEGLASFKLLENQLRNKSSVVNTLFNEGEIKQVSDLLRLGRRLGSPVMSSSGTGASNVFKDLFRSIPENIVSEQVIDSMKAKARKLPGAPSNSYRLMDSLEGLTNQEAQIKIETDPKFSKIREGIKKLKGANPRSKASQLISTQNDREKASKD